MTIVSPLAAASRAEAKWFNGTSLLPRSELSVPAAVPPVEATYQYGPLYTGLTETKLDGAPVKEVDVS